MKKQKRKNEKYRQILLNTEHKGKILKHMKFTTTYPELSNYDLKQTTTQGQKTKIMNICANTNRVRATYKNLAISRIRLRELSHSGKLPGFKKHSW